MPDLLAFRMTPLSLGETGRSERVFGLLVSDDYFPALGLRPARGRLLAPTATPGEAAASVAVVSHDFWQTRMAALPGIVGRSIRVNGRDLTVVGVAPRGFQGTTLGLSFDLWVRAELAPFLLGGSRELADRGQRGYTVMGRLAPGATRATAQGEIDAAMWELARVHPDTNAAVAAEVLPLTLAPRGPQRFMAMALALLQAVMLLLLLAVCANTANLILARAGARQREIGVRQALGAGRGRIVRLLLTENLLLGLMGAALGAAIASWATDAMRAVPLTGAMPIRFQTRVDLAGLAFAGLLGTASALAFGLAPALHLARTDTLRALRDLTHAGRRGRLQSALMAAEAAVALVVLVVAALPGVEAAAVSRSVPLDIHGLPSRTFTLEGRARPDGAEDRALSNVVTPGYFRALGIPVLDGSDFVALDDTSTAAQVVVNEEFVRRFLEGGPAVGRRLRSRGETYSIAGVVKTSTYDTFGEPPRSIVYFSYRDRPAASGEIHVRTRPGAEMRMVAGLRQAVRELDPALLVFDIRTMAEHIDKNLVFRRIPARMFAALGPLLLALAAIGVYGVVSFTVARRTAEIGVRMALGATTRNVVSQIVGESLRTVGKGALAGWLVAIVVFAHAARPGTSPAAVLLGVPAVLLLVAAAAAWLPARRAAAVPPMVALRHE
ncbi:MAG TPA: ABC transporter permease [Vicinamibacteria bacterium]|nr:ABC transporter permease [Vicinamibacteria bacterium]